MRTMVENYFVKNLVVLGHVANEDNSAEVLRRNSYTLLNVSPRMWQDEAGTRKFEQRERQEAVSR